MCTFLWIIRENNLCKTNESRRGDTRITQEAEHLIQITQAISPVMSDHGSCEVCFEIYIMQR